MPYDEPPPAPPLAGGEHLQPFEPSGGRPRDRLIFDEFVKTARRARVDPTPEALFAMLGRLFPPKRASTGTRKRAAPPEGDQGGSDRR